MTSKSKRYNVAAGHVRNCWLACELWHEPGLDHFWRVRLSESREAVSWEKELLVVNRLIEPGSEFRKHWQWFDGSAMNELSQVLNYLTSTYFEGDMEQNPKARRGYSRDGRSDCAQLGDCAGGDAGGRSQSSQPLKTPLSCPR